MGVVCWAQYDLGSFQLCSLCQCEAPAKVKLPWQPVSALIRTGDARFKFLWQERILQKGDAGMLHASVQAECMSILPIATDCAEVGSPLSSL
jgi:hypothetical protein